MENIKNKSNLMLHLYASIACIALITYIICVLVTAGDSRVLISNILFMTPVAIANLIIVYAFAKHNKNVMKSLLGFILSGLVMLSIHYAFSYYDPSSWNYIVKTVMFVIICIFTFNQFLLANEHYGSPIVLFINQLLVIIISVLSVVSLIVDCVVDKDNPLIFISLLAFVCLTMLLVLEMEMKINDAKVERSEKGYIFVRSTTNDTMLPKEDMFITNKLFNSLPWIVLVGLVALIVFNATLDKFITWGYSVRYLIDLIKFVVLLAVVIAYKKHNSDVLKIMLGFLLGMLMFENIFEMTTLAKDSLVNLKSITTISMVAINVIFLVDHLLLTQSHASNPKIVKMMQIAYIVYAVLTLVVAIDCSIYYIIGKGNNYYFFIFKPLIWILGTFPVISAILTIDTRVNGFKMRREKLKQETK